MSKYLSRKIQFITLFAMLSVVFIHSYNFSDSFLTPTTSISEGLKFGALFQYFFSNALLRFAVPLFFIISGYLFYRKFESIKSSYLKKLKNRFFSLVIPYFLWALFSGLLLFLMSYNELLFNIPIVAEKVQFTLWGCLLNPPAFQLWYLQQLIIFTVISPLIYLAVKYTRGFILILFGLFWLLDLHFIINSQALFFFSFGAYVSIFNKHKYFIRKDKPLFTTLITIFWVLLSAVITLLASLQIDNIGVTLIRLIMYKINEVVGVISVWVLFDHIFKRIIKNKIMVLASNHLFFIFVLHEPLLHFTYQLALMSNNSDLSHLIIYIFLPISVIAFCIIIGMCVKKINKNLYNVLTGGRPHSGKLKI